MKVPGDCAGRANLFENFAQIQNQNKDEDSDDSSLTDYVHSESELI